MKSEASLQDRLQKIFPIHYSHDDVLVINADCMEILPQIPDKYYSLCIVDPPYGIKEDGKKNHSRGKLAKPTQYTSKSWDRQKPDDNYFNELKRVSKNQIIWGANHFGNMPPSSGWIV